jgi:hypothetical protein
VPGSLSTNAVVRLSASSLFAGERLEHPALTRTTRFEFANANDDLKAHLNAVGFGHLFGGLETKPPRRTPDLTL